MAEPKFDVERTPYEVLFRFRDGALTGAHVVWEEWKTVNGTRIPGLAATETDAQPLAVGGEAGFPLTEIMSKVQRAAVETYEAGEAERDDLRTRLEAAEEACLAAETRAEAAEARVAAITQIIAAS